MLKIDRRHGHAIKGNMSPEYRAYHAMIKRCYQQSNKDYHNYGGRGITVCDRWIRGTSEQTGFQCFLDDMGTKPTTGHTLDRVNSDKEYSPDNCKWSTHLEQNRNRRNTLKDGNQTLSEIAAETGNNYYTIFSRWKAGDRGERLRRPVLK